MFFLLLHSQQCGVLCNKCGKECNRQTRTCQPRLFSQILKKQQWDEKRAMFGKAGGLLPLLDVGVHRRPYPSGTRRSDQWLKHRHHTANAQTFVQRLSVPAIGSPPTFCVLWRTCCSFLLSGCTKALVPYPVDWSISHTRTQAHAEVTGACVSF